MTVTRYWTGFTQKWFSPSNWAGSNGTSAVPGIADNVTIDSAITASNPVLVQKGDAQANSIEISQGNLLYVQTGGTLTVATDIDLVGYDQDTLLISDGASVTIDGGLGNLNIGETRNGANGGGYLVIGSNKGAGTGALAGTLSAANVYLNTLGSQLLFNVNSGVTYTFSVNIRSDGGVTQQGVNTTIILTGANDYLGVTTISVGILQIGAGGAAGSIGAGDIVDNAKLKFDVTTPTVIANTISGSGTVEFAGAATYSLTGASTITGIMTIDAGVLVAVGASASLGMGSVTDNGTLSFAPPSALTVANVISGSGSVLLGFDDLTLSGASTYTGATTVGGDNVEAALHAGGDDDFSAMSDVAVDSGGVLDLDGFSDTIGGLNGVGVVDNIAPRSGTLTIAQKAASEEFDGTIQNQGSGLILVVNAGDALDTFILAGVDSATGQTTIENGVLQIGDGGTQGSIASAIVIDANGILEFDLSNAIVLSQSISGSGGLGFERGTNYITANETSFTGQVGIASAAIVDLGGGSAAGSLGAVHIVDNGELDLDHSGAFTTNNAISGTGSLVIDVGTEVLNAAASYSGVTDILDDTLKAGAANVLSAHSVVFINPGATLDLGNSSQTIGGLSGAGTVDDGASSTLTIDDALAETYSGTLSNVRFLTKTGAGTQILAQTSPYAVVATTIGAGTLQLGNGGASALAGGGFTDNAELAFDYAGPAKTYQGLTIKGTGGVSFAGQYIFAHDTFSYAGTTTIAAGSSVTIGVGSTYSHGAIVDNGKLTFNASATTTLGKAITGSGSLHVQTGDVVLTNALNTFSGGVFIDSGKLSTASDGAVDDSIVTFSNGSNAAAWEATGNFQFFAEFVVTTGKSVTVEAVAGVTMGAFFGSGGGAGTTLHIGSTADTGAVGLQAAASLPGGGALSIDGGQANVSDANFAALVTSMTGGVTVNGAITLSGRSLTAYDLQGDGLISDGYDADGTPLSPATLTVFDADSGSAFSGLIDKSLSLAVTGSASIFTFTGDDAASTTINSGATLQLGDATTDGSLNGDLADNGTFDYFNVKDTAFSHKLSGSGTLYKDGASRLTLSGDGGAFSGIVSLDAGVLTLASVTGLGAAHVKAFGGALEATVFTSVSGGITVSAATTFEAAAGVILSLTGAFDDSSGRALRFGSAIDTGTVQLGKNGGAGLGAGATIEIDGGALNVASDLSLTAAPVTFMGTTGKLVLNGTAAAVSVSNGAGATGEVDLNSAQVKLAGGGDTVAFVTGSNDAVTLSGTNNVLDTVNGSSGSVTLSGAQAKVTGDSDAVVFASGTTGNKAALNPGGGDTVSGFGAGDTIAFYGVAFIASDYATYVGNGLGTGGTLSVRNAAGAAIAGATLSGSYNPSNFVLSSDGGALAIAYTAGHANAKAGDLNGDGKSDILFKSQAGALASWQLNDTAIGGGGNIGDPGTAWTVQGQGDFDGDGKGDILWRNQNGTLDIWEMSGTTIKGGGGVGNPGAQWRVVGAGDVNGDGAGDIVFADAGGDLLDWEMKGTARIGGGALGNRGAGWKVLGLGDFNGDGKSDALFENASGQYATWLLSGTQIIGGAALGTLGGDWVFKGLGDFNGDGLSDILFENVKSGLYATWDIVDDAISGGGNVGTPGSSWSVASVGDYNGDGKSDILFRNGLTGQYASWDLNDTTIVGGAAIGNPGASFAPAGAAPAARVEPAATIVLATAAGVLATWKIANGAVTGGGTLGNPGAGWTALAVGDFYGDGQSDALFQNANGTYALWRTDGASITGGGDIGLASGYVFRGLGDFNGDGIADMLFQNAAGNYATWLLNGTSIIGGANLGNPGAGFSFAGVGDFTGGGTSDLLFKDSAGNYWTWLVGNDGMTSGAEIGSPGAGWSLKGVGDLNGDGKADLLFENASGAYASWDLNGGSIIGGGTIGNPGSQWTYAGIADLNAANFASIVFENAAGQVATWLMNDTTIAGGSTLGTASGFTVLAAR